MKLPVFFEQIMGIREPWYIKEINVEGMEVNITIDFRKGSKFEYQGELCTIHDTVERQWRHRLFKIQTAMIINTKLISPLVFPDLT